MIQYCRYCGYAMDYNGEGTDFLCLAPAPCGNDGSGMFYDAQKAKRPNKCKFFDFNECDIFRMDEYGNYMTYKPREKMLKLEQIKFKVEKEDEHQMRSKDGGKKMTLNKAIQILNEVIPPPTHHLVDLEHLQIAQAWETIKSETIPIKKGSWHFGVNSAEVECTNCHATYLTGGGNFERYYFCPNCGADMRG